ncbi:MAG: DUF1587 domain-containing protein, partial [Acidobacteriota bacterium]|nr:DUF1587 domain-containing protein [Acidobacteriota bacterium]
MSREAHLWALFAFAGLASGQNTNGPEYRDRVAPILANHCIGCHGEKQKTADLNLEHPGNATAVWEKVLDKLKTGRMPPPGSPALSKKDAGVITTWIESSAGLHSSTAGRVTTRRLNRVEYNNTVHDLLGVALHPADEFPLDDAGYGFDNIGDVLSVSPLLMEKYVSAARKLSRAAVYGEPVPLKPTKLTRFLSKKAQDDPTPNALPYSLRGAIYGKFDFPATAEYELRMRVGNYRPRKNGSARQKELASKPELTEAEKRELKEENRKSDPPVTMVLTVDGAPVLTEVVEGNIDFQYAHGESVARVKVIAGEHSFRASFPEFAGMENPRDNVNRDGRRKLFIDYVDIVGPFHPVVPANQKRQQVFICGQKTPQCAQRIVEDLVTRAYRRPATAHETAQLVNLTDIVYKDGETFEEGIRVAVQAILASPSFLFRIEGEPAGVSTYTLDEHDLASRLSYFLWSSMPDEELARVAN